MQLIDNASQLLKMHSVQLAGLTGVLAIAEQALPSLQAFIPPGAYAVLMVLVVLARSLKQTKLD